MTEPKKNNGHVRMGTSRDGTPRIAIRLDDDACVKEVLPRPGETHTKHVDVGLFALVEEHMIKPESLTGKIGDAVIEVTSLGGVDLTVNGESILPPNCFEFNLNVRANGPHPIITTRSHVCGLGGGA